ASVAVRPSRPICGVPRRREASSWGAGAERARSRAVKLRADSERARRRAPARLRAERARRRAKGKLPIQLRLAAFFTVAVALIIGGAGVVTYQLLRHSLLAEIQR